MATKLKNLKIRKVDFVDEGANPDAHIRMLKRRDGETQTTEEEHKKGTSSILKRLFGFIGKAAGMNQEEIDSAIDEIQKGDSLSFNEKINEVKNYKIADEMWDTCYALQSSLCSILNDEDMDSTSTQVAMQESLDEFYAVVQESIKEWSSGKSASIVRKSEEVSEEDLEIMKSAVERLNETIEKACKDTKKEKSEKNGPGNNEKPKGDEEEMKIDKSKLTDAERAFLDSIEKRYGVEDQPAGGVPAAVPTMEVSAAPSVEKSAPRTEVPAQSQVQPQTSEQQTVGDDGIYKGLHPTVKAELEELKKFREATEERELNQVAEKYVIIGKKKEDLVPLFKSLKAAGGTAYNDMIAVLDQAVETVEKSGAFSEIGKSGHGSGAVGAAEAKVEVIAKGYMEKDSSLDYASAMAKAWEDNPELMAEYEAEAGF